MTTVLDRLISKEYLKLFLLIIISFLSLYLIVDFFERIRMFMSNHATLSQIISYFFFKIPMIISQIIPAAALLAALITFGSMSRSNEIVALKANGISLYRTAASVVTISFIICIFAFSISEFITPYTNQVADRILYVNIQKKQTFGTFKQNQIWYRGKNAIYNFKMFDPETSTIKGITINYLNKKFELTKRIDAEMAEWRQKQWTFYNLLITNFNAGDFPSIERAAMKVIDLPEKPSDFTSIQKDADKMGFFELKEYIKKIKSEGYDATRYLVDLHGKIAFSLVSILLAVIGISFSLKSSARSGSIGRSIGTGIIVGFSYWLVFAFTMSLGRSGTLTPFIAAWFADFLFGIFALIMFLRVRT
jgi:lipopolysaccharide export system permease protein